MNMSETMNNLDRFVSPAPEDEKLIIFMIGMLMVFLGYMISTVFGPVGRIRWFLGTIILFLGLFAIGAKDFLE
jgi:hypothetical protein